MNGLLGTSSSSLLARTDASRDQSSRPRVPRERRRLGLRVRSDSNVAHDLHPALGFAVFGAGSPFARRFISPSTLSGERAPFGLG